MLNLSKNNKNPISTEYGNSIKKIDMMEEVRISDLLQIKNGYAFKSEDYQKQGIPLLRITNIENEKVHFGSGSVFLPKNFENEYSDFLVKNGDVVIALSGATTGKFGVYTLKVPSLLNQRIGLIRSGSSDRVDSTYFYYFLNQIKAEILNKAQGVAQPNISTKEIGQFQIPLPPLPVQQKIAAILDAADLHRQKTKTLIEKYDQLTQSIFLEMFGGISGNSTTLGEVCEINPKKSEIAHLSNETLISFIPMSNISEQGEVDLSQNRTIKEVWNGFTYFKENDVAFAKITPCMENGKGGIMRDLSNGIGFGTTEFHILRPIKNISTPEWIYYLTASKHFRSLAESNMTGSAGQKRVPKAFLENFKVDCPSFDQQEKFALRIKLIQKQKAKSKIALEKAEDLFNTLLQRAFKGELVN
jgi:type I restriction enzyme, S subunit